MQRRVNVKSNRRTRARKYRSSAVRRKTRREKMILRLHQPQIFRSTFDASRGSLPAANRVSEHKTQPRHGIITAYDAAFSKPPTRLIPPPRRTAPTNPSAETPQADLHIGYRDGFDDQPLFFSAPTGHFVLACPNLHELCGILTKKSCDWRSRLVDFSFCFLYNNGRKVSVYSIRRYR